ncbi:MAG: SUF system Fe-S cluster assembly regulator [Burkholderiales bacterium]|nr:SUF system Fe-S cluster assembly regulator [Burkholderiales bacterium]
MLKISKLADYGTLILTCLVREPQRLQSAVEVAAQLGLPAPTVSKVLKILARNGLLTSARGTCGGYLLARPASEITVADVIGALDGPLGLTECAVARGLCMQESSCRVRNNWLTVNQIVLRALQQVTLEKMGGQLSAQATIDFVQTQRAKGKSIGG